MRHTPKNTKQEKPEWIYSQGNTNVWHCWNAEHSFYVVTKGVGEAEKTKEILEAQYPNITMSWTASIKTDHPKLKTIL